MTKSAWFFALAMVLGATGAFSAEKTKTYDLPAFTALEASGELELKIVASAKSQSVRLTADEDVLADMDLKVVDGRLEIGRTVSSGWRWPWEGREVDAVIEVKSLEALDLGGAVDLEVTGLQGDDFRLEISGAAKAELAGRVKTFTLDLSGASKIKAFDLVAETVKANVTGAGKVECHATKILDAEVSGVGKVTYAGQPTTVRQDVSGVGKVTPRG